MVVVVAPLSSHLKRLEVELWVESTLVHLMILLASPRVLSEVQYQVSLLDV